MQDLVEDGMSEYIPETDAYLRDLGLMVEHESMLPGLISHTAELEAVATGSAAQKVLAWPPKTLRTTS